MNNLALKLAIRIHDNPNNQLNGCRCEQCVESIGEIAQNIDSETIQPLILELAIALHDNGRGCLHCDCLSACFKLKNGCRCEYCLDTIKCVAEVLKEEFEKEI